MNLNSQAPQGNTGEQTEFKPKDWNEVFKEFEGRMSAYLSNHFEPVLNEVKQVKQKQIETILDEEAPEWREYEDDMIGLHIRRSDYVQKQKYHPLCTLEYYEEA